MAETMAAGFGGGQEPVEAESFEVPAAPAEMNESGAEKQRGNSAEVKVRDFEAEATPEIAPFEKGQQRSLEAEMDELTRAIDERFGKKDKGALAHLTANIRNSLSKIAEKRLKFKLIKLNINVSVGDLTNLLAGMAVGAVTSTSAKKALYAATGLQGAAASAIVGAVMGGARAGLRESAKANRELLGTENWKEQIEAMESPAEKMRAIELLIKDKKAGKKFKSDAEGARELVGVYQDIALQVEESELNALLSKKSSTEAENAARESLAEYIGSFGKEKRARVLKSIGKGAARGAIFAVAGYGLFKLGEQFLGGTPAYAEGGGHSGAGATPGTPEAGTHHTIDWRGEGDQARLAIDPSNGHFAEGGRMESIVDIKYGGGNHEIAQVIAKSISEGQKGGHFDMTDAQRSSFEKSIENYLNNHNAIQNGVAHIPAAELNQALDKADLHLDAGHLHGVKMPAQTEAPAAAPQETPPVQPEAPAPASPPEGQTPTVVAPPPPSGHTPVQPAAEPSSATPQTSAPTAEESAKAEMLKVRQAMQKDADFFNEQRVALIKKGKEIAAKEAERRAEIVKRVGQIGAGAIALVGLAALAMKSAKIVEKKREDKRERKREEREIQEKAWGAEKEERERQEKEDEERIREQQRLEAEEFLAPGGRFETETAKGNRAFIWHNGPPYELLGRYEDNIDGRFPVKFIDLQHPEREPGGIRLYKELQEKVIFSPFPPKEDETEADFRERVRQYEESIGAPEEEEEPPHDQRLPEIPDHEGPPPLPSQFDMDTDLPPPPAPPAPLPAPPPEPPAAQDTEEAGDKDDELDIELEHPTAPPRVRPAPLRTVGRIWSGAKEMVQPGRKKAADETELHNSLGWVIPNQFAEMGGELKDECLEDSFSLDNLGLTPQQALAVVDQASFEYQGKSGKARKEKLVKLAKKVSEWLNGQDLTIKFEHNAGRTNEALDRSWGHLYKDLGKLNKDWPNVEFKFTGRIRLKGPIHLEIIPSIEPLPPKGQDSPNAIYVQPIYLGNFGVFRPATPTPAPTPSQGGLDEEERRREDERIQKQIEENAKVRPEIQSFCDLYNDYQLPDSPQQYYDHFAALESKLTGASLEEQKMLLNAQINMIGAGFDREKKFTFEMDGEEYQFISASGSTNELGRPYDPIFHRPLVGVSTLDGAKTLGFKVKNLLETDPSTWKFEKIDGDASPAPEPPPPAPTGPSINPPPVPNPEGPKISDGESILACNEYLDGEFQKKVVEGGQIAKIEITNAGKEGIWQIVGRSENHGFPILMRRVDDPRVKENWLLYEDSLKNVIYEQPPEPDDDPFNPLDISPPKPPRHYSLDDDIPNSAGLDEDE